MCQYSYEDGFISDWTLVAIGSYAVRGAALSMIEATAVSPEGRITPYDAGLWKDEHIAPFKRVADFVHSQNHKLGVQIAHAGRLGSTGAPWTNVKGLSKSEGGYDTVAPSPGMFTPESANPTELTIPEIKELVQKFKETAVRAAKAGVDVIEIHAAHGYLINEFLSSVTNHRNDEYGGSFEGRIKFLVEIINEVKSAIPENVLLFVRISASDRLEYKNEGWTVEDSIRLLEIIQPLGIDLVDVSTGGNTADGKIAYGPGFQAPLAYQIKKALPGLQVSSVGKIHTPETIDEVLSQDIDAITVGRPFSHNPSFVLDLAREYEVQVQWPVQIGYTTRHN